MRILILALLVCCLPSCKAVGALLQNQDSIQTVIGGVAKLADAYEAGKARLAELKETFDASNTDTTAKLAAVVGGISALKGSFDSYTKAKKDADADGDGKTTMDEWIKYGLTLAAGGGGVGAIAKMLGQRRVNRELAVRNTASDTLKAGLKAQLDALTVKVNGGPGS
jgi:hypothetical protein